VDSRHLHPTRPAAPDRRAPRARLRNNHRTHRARHDPRRRPRLHETHPRDADINAIAARANEGPAPEASD
jgi:hypothetical protein